MGRFKHVLKIFNLPAIHKEILPFLYRSVLWAARVFIG
jgi:hypothetical protein